MAHLREERPLILGLLDAVGHQPLHGFGAVLVELTEVWGQIASSHHVDNLPGSHTEQMQRNIYFKSRSRVNTVQQQDKRDQSSISRPAQRFFLNMACESKASKNTEATVKAWVCDAAEIRDVALLYGLAGSAECKTFCSTEEKWEYGRGL